MLGLSYFFHAFLFVLIVLSVRIDLIVLSAYIRHNCCIGVRLVLVAMCFIGHIRVDVYVRFVLCVPCVLMLLFVHYVRCLVSVACGFLC